MSMMKNRSPVDGQLREMPRGRARSWAAILAVAWCLIAAGCSASGGEHQVVCGDGVAEGAEECDFWDRRGIYLCYDLYGHGWSGTPSCTSVCTLDTSECINTESCGTGYLNEGEGCDDGNLDDGDGCSHNCVIEESWVCSGEPSLCTPVYIVYVDVQGTGSVQDGSSWATAFRTVQEGVSLAAQWAAGGEAVVEIWVASGTYYEHVTLAEGTPLYGGFRGNESARSARNWRSNRTILDGQGSGSVITGEDLSVVVVDGFIVRNGNAAYGGGGLYASGSAVEVANCTFENNEAATSGGAILAGMSELHVTNSVFTDNHSGSEGGAITVTGYWAGVGNCVFDGNMASRGGAIYANSANVSSTNSTFYNNYAGADSAVFHGLNGCGLHIMNGILWGNQSGLIQNYGLGNETDITYSDVEGGEAGTGNINADPRFTNAAGGVFTLQSNSPCIDSGEGTGAREADLLGNPMVDAPGVPNTGTGTPNYVDMGAYEFQG